MGTLGYSVVVSWYSRGTHGTLGLCARGRTKTEEEERGTETNGEEMEGARIEEGREGLREEEEEEETVIDDISIGGAIETMRGLWGMEASRGWRHNSFQQISFI